MSIIIMADIAGAVLAGGKSTRMGQDKALLMCDGRTLRDSREALLQEAGVSACYVSDAENIADVIPACGPLSGIHAVLTHCMDKGHDFVIFVPVDMPCLTVEVIQRLMAAPEEMDLVHFAAYKLPFRLAVKQRWLTLAERLLQEGENFSVGNFQRHIEARCVLEMGADEGRYFDNVNSPDEWDSFLMQREK